jgi:DNA adenine methylase
VIGGFAQAGKWKIDARYPKKGLIRRIKRITSHSNRITLTCLDAIDYVVDVVPGLGSNGLVYLDPPYVEKSKRLYENSYELDDHAAIAAVVRNLKCPWIVTYDDVPKARELYRGEAVLDYTLDYSAARRRVGREVMFGSPFFKDSLEVAETPLRPIQA